jgi:hypothetical protein
MRHTTALFVVLTRSPESSPGERFVASGPLGLIQLTGEIINETRCTEAIASAIKKSRIYQAVLQRALTLRDLKTHDTPSDEDTRA